MGWGRELGRTALFKDVDPRALETLGSRAVRRIYRKGNVVFVQGEHGTRCFAILSGAVKISAFHDDGREAVLAVLGPGDVFGELSLFEDAPRSADATIIEEAELLSLDREAVRSAIAEHPEIALSLMRVLCRRLRLANEAFQDVAFFDVAGRVARRLSDLAATHGTEEARGTMIDLPLSQGSLASMVGATRESVNKALAGFTRRGLVCRDGSRYVVCDLEGLRRRAR